MTLETQDFRQIASALSSLRSSLWFTNPVLASRHTQIQNQLMALAGFFNRIALLVEQSESSLASRQKSYVAQSPGFNASYSASGSLNGLMRGRSASITGDFDYAAIAGSNTWSSGGASSSFSADMLAVSGNAGAAFRLKKNDRYDPSLSLTASASGHVAGAEATAGYSAGAFEAQVRAAGEAGVAYAEAEAVISSDEVTLSAQAGAALARGECELAIELAGVRVTFGLSGSLGSVEAGFGYSAKANEWETSVNFGLLAGAGLSVRVETP